MVALLLALVMDAEAARGFAGLALRPLSRQDLVWVEEGRTSGTAVGEFDGTLRPTLGAFGGAWFNRWVGLSVELTWATLQQASRTEETRRRATVGVLRPGLDLRFGWMEPGLHRAVPWVVLGVHGDIPTARERDTGFTEAEQEAADAVARDTRYRLGGVGGRVGLGLDYRVLPGLMLGGQATVGLHRAGYTGGDARFTTLWVATDVSLLVTFEWPGRSGRTELTGRAPAPGTGGSSGR